MTFRFLILAAALCALAACSSAEAHPRGVWRLDPRLCPDLREDFRDARVVRGRRDLREDQRDYAVVRCPASAYVYVPPRGVRAAYLPALPRYYNRVYIGPKRTFYTLHRGRHVPIAVVRY